MNKVIALESFKGGVLRTYGEGVLLKDRVPNADPFKKHAISNPCIKLDNGKYVWGFQCWWGEVEKFNEKYGAHITETIQVDVPDEVLPMEG